MKSISFCPYAAREGRKWSETVGLGCAGDVVVGCAVAGCAVADGHFVAVEAVAAGRVVVGFAADGPVAAGRAADQPVAVEAAAVGHFVDGSVAGDGPVANVADVEDAASAGDAGVSDWRWKGSQRLEMEKEQMQEPESEKES